MKKGLIEGVARAVLSAQKCEGAELSVLLVNDRRMRVLNRQYRGRDKTTDVLSFAMREGEPMPGEPLLLGDVVISLPTAGRQAAEKGHSLEREVAILLIHGILHLLGYDHEQGEREAQRMERLEKRLLAKIEM